MEKENRKGLIYEFPMGVATETSYFYGKTPSFGNYMDFGRRMIYNERKRVNMPA